MSKNGLGLDCFGSTDFSGHGRTSVVTEDAQGCS